MLSIVPFESRNELLSSKIFKSNTYNGDNLITFLKKEIDFGDGTFRYCKTESRKYYMVKFYKIEL